MRRIRGILALLEKGQRYTEDFAAVKGIFEGRYISTPDTYVLTHTSRDAIGMTTRSGESLKAFKNTILAKQQLTNLGTMKSPGTGSMIISMYYPLFEGQRCIGYVGAGVYASRLMDALLDLDIAVVSGEVRELASKSAEAAGNTGALIGREKRGNFEQIIRSGKNAQSADRPVLYSLKGSFFQPSHQQMIIFIFVRQCCNFLFSVIQVRCVHSISISAQLYCDLP